jgi:threonine dehydratase
VSTLTTIPTFHDVREAAQRIAPHAHTTPVMTCSAIDATAGRALFFKCEMFQKVGAFKFRGACNAIMKLPPAAAERGVVTHSSGNHAQAIALAAKLRGIRADIVMPKNSSQVKVRAVEGYGAHVHLCEPNSAAREGTAEQIARARSATLIPPYNHADIIAGQGTSALELLAEVPDLDAVIAPVGGGGLISGTSLAAHGINPRIKVFGAEPAGADDAARSLAAGRIIPQDKPDTICDGLRTGLGELTWAIISEHVERIFTQPDEKAIAAMRLIMERMKLVNEVNSALALAVVLSEEFRAAAQSVKRVGVILSGGNVDLDHLPWRG